MNPTNKRYLDQRRHVPADPYMQERRIRRQVFQEKQRLGLRGVAVKGTLVLAAIWLWFSIWDVWL